MRNLLIGLVASAVSLWIAAWILPGVAVVPWGEGTPAAIGTYLVVAAIFGLVNGLLLPIIRFATACLYVLTLGLFGLVVNGLLFLLVGWISRQIGWGLEVDGFWWAVGGAIIMGISSALIGVLTAGLRRRDEA